jgi:hypothetical protein
MTAPPITSPRLRGEGEGCGFKPAGVGFAGHPYWLLLRVALELAQ